MTKVGTGGGGLKGRKQGNIRGEITVVLLQLLLRAYIPIPKPFLTPDGLDTYLICVPFDLEFVLGGVNFEIGEHLHRGAS